MPKSILEVDVKDEKFKKFLDMFKKYQDQLGKMGEFWGDAAKAAEKTEASSESMAGVIAVVAASSALMVDALERSNSASERTTSAMSTMAGHAKSIAGSIAHATINIARWATLSLGAGLIGGGAGVFGLDMLANAVSGQRKGAQGLGITSAQQQAFDVNFGTRLVGTDFLAGVQNVKSDLASQWKLNALGVNTNEDTATAGVDVIRRARDLWNRTSPQNRNQQAMMANGLEGIMDFGTWQRIGQASQSDMDKYIQQYSSDVKTMGASNSVQTDWQNFSVQMKRAADQIEAVFVTGLDPLIPALTKLSGSVEKALAGFLANPRMKDWIEAFGTAIEHAATYLGSDKFQSDLRMMADGVAYAAEKIVGGLRFLHFIPQAEATGPGPGGDAADPSNPSIYGNHTFSWAAPWNPGWNMDFGPDENKYGLPKDLLRNIGMQESGLNPNVKDSVVNGAHYQGMMQLGPDAQKQYGVTDPYDSNQAANAAGMDLRDLIKKYQGNVAEALAAYNWGEGKVDDDVKQHGKDWLKYAPDETQKYVADIAKRMNVTITVMNQTGANIAMLANSVRQ